MKIIFWQIFLAIVQGFGFYIGGKNGLIFELILVLFLTVTQTYGGLLVFQFIVQCVVAIILYKSNIFRKT